MSEVKLILGDALEELKKIPSESIDLVLTDPPYGINFVPMRDNAKSKFGSEAIKNDELKGDDWVLWFKPIAKELYRVLKNNSVAYFFSGFNPYYYYKVFIELGFEIKASIVWVKDNWGLGYHFRRQYELCIVCFKGSPPTPLKAISDVVHVDKVKGSKLVHSCQKPEQLNELLLRQYTKEGDVVLDPFMGSGSTGVACVKANRGFIGVEIDEKYFNVAKSRLEHWEKQTRLF